MLKLIQQGEALPPGLTPGRSGSRSPRMDGGRSETTCDECGSTFHADRSNMSGLCAECAHQLYGYPACEHRFVAGRCESCGWDGSVSPYVASLTGRGKTVR